ncbi:OmpA family protein [Croceitalea marina]|uniref:OmpA family protein n=1 Tax=Croceitalea marina TaxID=1775166 RepID=A0ABW5MUY1_9FLAO
MAPDKRIILILLSVFLCKVIRSQNLVLNGSFESYLECPKKKGTLEDSCKNIKAPTKGSTDYFHECGLNGLGIPKNFNGEQFAYEGDAYAGLYLYSPNNYREYIQFELGESLKKGKTYKASIRLCIAENSVLAVQNVSVLFTQQELDLNINENLSPKRLNHFKVKKFSYQNLEIKESIFNYEKWGLLEVEFEAKGYEKYMIFGNFKNDKDSRTVRLDLQKSTLRPISYYYIDDVSVQLEEKQEYAMNTPFVLNKLQFKFDSFELTDKAKEDVLNVFYYLRKNPNVQLHISGHTDSVGSDFYNQYLSSRRARAVALFLQERGIASDRINWEGKGDKSPLYKNDTEKARDANRRVEFVITEFEDKN